MIYVLLLSAAGSQVTAAQREAHALPCSVAKVRQQRGTRQVDAVLDFDGLEHTFISSTACPNARSIEVVSGFSLPGKVAEKLHDNILSSARKSRPGLKYIVRFRGVIFLRKSESGEVVADIKSVCYSRVEAITSAG